MTYATVPVADGTLKIRLSQLPTGDNGVRRAIVVQKFMTGDVPTKRSVTIPLAVWPRFFQKITEVHERLNNTDWLSEGRAGAGQN